MVITSDEEALEAWETIRHIEDRYNRGRYYPWVILSPQPLSDRTQTLLQRIPFASRLRTNNIDNEEEEEEEDRGTAAAIMFEFISRKQWKFPRWVEALKGRSEDFSRLKLGLNATLVAVRRRKRYMSGFLDLHDLLNGYEIFWRINPGLVVFCDLEDGPMLAMKHSGQKFGYTDYFNVIDKEGPIYYECWEDDTVITIGLSLLLPRNDIRFLKELGWGYSNGGTGSGTGIGVVPPKGSAASAAASAALTTETATTQVLYCPRNPDQNKVCHCDPKWKTPRSHLSCTSFWMGLTTSPRRRHRRVCTPDGNCKVFVTILEPGLLKGEVGGRETVASSGIVVPVGSRGEEYYY